MDFAALLMSIVTWYAVMQFLALVGLPLAFAWLRALPSRGYAVAKALGLLLTGVIFWWGNILHLWRNTTAALVTSAGLLFALGLWAMRGHWGEVRGWWRTHFAFIVLTEIIWFCALVFWALVRATQPQLETAGGEKWMEIAFLNAILRTPAMPPHDPWLSGYAISYYYLGYLLLGLLTRLAGLPASVAFNLGNAGWYALVAVGAYSIVYDLLATRQNRVSRLSVTLASLFAPLMLLLTGNGQGFLEVLHARGWFSTRFWRWLDIRHLNEAPTPPFSWVPQRFFWWWQASRTLQDYTPWGERQEVIDEFPAFSFILGDMHPHVLALPFVLLLIALALNLYRQRIPTRASWWQDWPRRFLPLIPYAVILGTLGFLNTWDLPIYWALLVGALALGAKPYYIAQAEAALDAAERPRTQWPAVFERLWELLPEAGMLGVFSIACYFPFWYALRSQAGGILPNLFNPTRVPHFAVMFAPLLVPLFSLVIAQARRAGVKATSVFTWGIGLMLGIAVVGVLIGTIAAYPYLVMVWRGEPVQGISVSPETVIQAIQRRVANPWIGLILSLAASAGLLTMAQRDNVSAAKAQPSAGMFALLMAILGLLLTLAPEFVYLQDVFMTRMNTIFKFYFQAWVLWSLAGAWQLARWLLPGDEDTVSDTHPLYRTVSAALAFILIGVGLVYTALAIPARAREHGVPWTLDGAAWLEQAYPQDAAAIQWINTNIEGTPVILETPGNAHKAYVYEGRVSAHTGLPTLLGWGGHERQWRGNYDEPGRREQDIERIYTTTNQEVAYELLELYNVSYVYIGPVELSRYPAEGLLKFAEMFPIAYARDGVTIYRVEL